MIDALASIRNRENEILIPGFNEQVRAPTQAELRAIAEQSDSMEEARTTYGIRTCLDDVTGAAYRERISFRRQTSLASTPAMAARE